MTKKRAAPRKKARTSGLSILRQRITTLERDMQTVKGDMGALSDEMFALKTVVTQVDKRTLRGEKLMLEMQGEQLRAGRTIDRIAQRLELAPEPPRQPVVDADPGDEPPPEATNPE